MNPELVEKLRLAQEALDPQFKALRAATGALQQAIKQAGEERADALAMQKVLAKLQQVNDLVENDALRAATDVFADQTLAALDALAFEFARDLKETFEERGEIVEGRPPTLLVNSLILQIDIAARKAQWLYGKEPLTRPIALSINTIMKAYDQQRRTIVERTTDDAPSFLSDLYRAWDELLSQRKQRPSGGYINLVSVYSQLVLNCQSARFWNAPSRSTFKDYARPFFVRDLVLAHANPTVGIDGQVHHLRLGVATKSQADNASRSVWLPKDGLDGEYYANITFEAAEES